MIEHVGWLKAFTGFLKTVFDRLALRFGRRKPNLYVHFQPGTCIWCIANQGSLAGPSAEYMQVMFSAGFTHDDPNQAW
jgi:hypothetical protein